MDIQSYDSILDSLSVTGIYVIREDNHEILYFNKRVKEVAPNIRRGMVCHEVWAGTCSNCPLLYIGDKKESKSINYDDPFGSAVDITATRIMWEETVPAFVITVVPHVEASSYVYDRILRCNLSSDSYEIVKGEQDPAFGHEALSLSQWVERFVNSGSIYEGDVERFRAFAVREHLQEELRGGKKQLICTYRRKTGNGFRWHTLEVVREYDYTDANQTVMLYVKDVHDIYREGLEREEVNIRNQEIIQSLGELNFAIYVVEMKNGLMNPVRVSEAMKKYVGSDLLMWDDFLENLITERAHPSQRDQFREQYALENLRGAMNRGEKKLEMLCDWRFDGEYRYVMVTAHFHGIPGKNGYAVLALQDVDERTRKELKRTQNDQRMSAVIKSMYGVMNTINLNNGQCERVFLEQSDQLEQDENALKGDYDCYLRQAMEKYVLEADRDAFWAGLSLDSLRKKAETVTDFMETVCQYRVKAEKIIWVEQHIFFLRQKDGMMVNMLGKDITEEKQKEEQIVLAAREKAYIINSLSSMFFATYYVDLNKETFRPIIQNEEVGEVLGMQRGYTEGILRYAQNFIHPDDRSEYLERMSVQNVKQVLSADHPMVAMEYRKADGQGESGSWIRATMVLAETRKGQPRTALYVAQDITESKQKEEQEKKALKEACDAATHANASKSEFLSKMSHDIRTPMNAIIGMTAIAGTHMEDRERVADCLKKITVSSKHLLSLINEVLDMSKIESGKVDLTEEEFNLGDLVQNLLTMTRPSVQEKGHELELHISNVKHEDVIGDVLRLQQVFMNILSNAVKYTPAGGKLDVEISEKESDIFGYGCYEFVFKDNGIGMSEEYVKTIFEPFSRAEDSRISRVEGTGLGMAIAQNIVRMMNGTIAVESRLGEGSKFTVTVFLKQRVTDDPDMRQFADLPVLVVDDEECDCEAACAVLEDLGMKGEWVLNGADAVGRVRNAHLENRDFFAVIVDWIMPEMDGIETARAIRSVVGPDVPIIILSAYDWSAVEEQARQAGVDGFISKPLFKSRLIYAFKRLLGDGEQETQQESQYTDYSFAGGRILLVEDNEINREIAEEIIGSTGVKVESAVNGQEALEMFENHPENYYDLIFMDIQMPVMNGHDASRAIRKLRRGDAKKIPIIAMTANAFAEDIVASRRAGMNEHIAKPLDVGQLMNCMNRWLKNEE